MYEYNALPVEERKRLVEERLANGFPPHSPPHVSSDSGHYLISAACYQHSNFVNTANRRQEILDKHFANMTLQGFTIKAWVILINHYYLLVKVDDFSRITKVIKQVHGSTSYAWNQEEGKQGRKIWYRFSDRAIRSERHYGTTLNYIHFNPVKHGLVSSPYDWEWSSVGWYLEHFGRQWLRDCWQRYPILDYGKGWDDL